MTNQTGRERREKSRRMSEIDRISSLPDCLLHHILSFLKTKNVVCTTILSKRWIDVWKSVPHLDLDDRDFVQVDTFSNFTDSILHNKFFPNPEKLDMFNLRMYTYDFTTYYHISKTWIPNLPSLKPKVVNIDVHWLRDLSMFSRLFECSTLENMFLSAGCKSWGCATLNPTVVNLPCLKKLQLRYLHFDGIFIKKIMLGCPTLEELVIERSFLKVENISSSSLKTLTIKDNEISSDVRLMISVPSLVHLDCKVKVGEISLENLDSLEFASVDLYGRGHHYLRRKEVKLLKGLINAKTIKLCGFWVKDMLKNELLDLPVFEKVESLDIGGFFINPYLEPLLSFLNRTPNLKYLALRDITMGNNLIGWRKIDIQSDCFKTVEIVSAKGHEEAYAFVAIKLRTQLQNIENISPTLILQRAVTLMNRVTCCFFYP